MGILYHVTLMVVPLEADAEPVPLNLPMGTMASSMAVDPDGQDPKHVIGAIVNQAIPVLAARTLNTMQKVGLPNPSGVQWPPEDSSNEYRKDPEAPKSNIVRLGEGDGK